MLFFEAKDIVHNTETTEQQLKYKKDWYDKNAVNIVSTLLSGKQQRDASQETIKTS